MLPGDIDLTEKLDFRKTVRKQLPALPNNWGGKNQIKVSNNTNFIRLNDVTNTTTSSTRNVITYVQNNLYSTIDNWTYYDIIDDDIDTINYYNNDYTFTISNRYSVTYNNSLSNNKISIKVKNYVEDTYKKDIFGNLIQTKKEEKVRRCPLCNSVLIPWDKNYCRSCRKLHNDNNDHKIPWNVNKYKNLKYREKYDPKIPWEEEDLEYKCKDLIFDGDEMNISEKICYLEGKTISFIRRYLNHEEEDNSSYLTNMNHIRIRDVEI